MNALQTLAQAAGVAYAAGLNLYATVGIIGLATKLGWIGPLPGSLDSVSSWWVIITALTLASDRVSCFTRPCSCLSVGHHPLTDSTASSSCPRGGYGLAW